MLRNPFSVACLTATLAATVTPVGAHEAPETPGQAGPVPEVLMRHAALMIYPNGVKIPFVVNDDHTLFWIEIVPELEKSFAGPATWTWEDNVFCMEDIEDHPSVCFELESALVPGKTYDSTIRYLEDGKEVGTKPFRFLLIRTE